MLYIVHNSIILVYYLVYRSEDWPEDSKNGPKDQGNYDGPPGMDPEGALDTNWHHVVESFDDMNLKEELLRGIYAYGFEKPSAIQQRAIMPCIQGRDVIAQAQSGTGKTATFSISILQQIDTSIRECQALILAPTRELAQQIQKVCLQFCAKIYSVCSVHYSTIISCESFSSVDH